MSKQNEVSIQFLGAAGTVTGSKYLVKAGKKNILLDCGLFQGLKELRLLNWENLPFPASSVDLVLLTHGHLDHTGYLPLLVKNGFEGEIWATPPTVDIAKIILEDSARIQEEDAVRANEGHYSKHHPAKPLYTYQDVVQTIPHFRNKEQDKWLSISDGIECRFNYVGHILGACFIELRIEGRVIVFSGDVGRAKDFLLYPPHKPETADIVVMESTYGNRIHREDSEQWLSDVINEAMKSQGTIIIPSFAVERTQVLLYLLWKLRLKKAIPELPVYLDTPMGTNVLDVFREHLSWHKLSAAECTEMCSYIIPVKTQQDSLKLAASTHPKIVIAGSGMAGGGRVLGYLATYIGDPKAVILFAGYQAEGTRGRKLLEGDSEIKMFGKYFAVKAQIKNIEGLSAHADQAGLIDWLSNLKQAPRKIFITHGEQDAAMALEQKIKEKYGFNTYIPVMNEIVKIAAASETISG